MPITLLLLITVNIYGQSLPYQKRAISDPASPSIQYLKEADSKKAEADTLLVNVDSLNSKLNRYGDTIAIFSKLISRYRADSAQVGVVDSVLQARISQLQNEIDALIESASKIANRLTYLDTTYNSEMSILKQDEFLRNRLNDSISSGSENPDSIRSIVVALSAGIDQKKENIATLDREKEAQKEAEYANKEQLKNKQDERDSRFNDHLQKTVRLTQIRDSLSMLRSDSARLEKLKSSARQQAKIDFDRAAQLRIEEKELREKGFLGTLEGFTVFPITNLEHAKKFYGQIGNAALRHFIFNGWSDRGSVYTEVYSGLIGSFRMSFGVTLAATVAKENETNPSNSDEAASKIVSPTILQSNSDASSSTGKKLAPTEALQRFVTSGGGGVFNLAFPVMMFDFPSVNLRSVFYFNPKAMFDVNLSTSESSEFTSWATDWTSEINTTFYIDDDNASISLNFNGGYVIGSTDFMHNIDWALPANRGYQMFGFIPVQGFGHLASRIGLNFMLGKSIYSLTVNMPVAFPNLLVPKLRPTVGVQITPVPDNE
jgi:hypothetical protein